MQHRTYNMRDKNATHNANRARRHEKHTPHASNTTHHAEGTATAADRFCLARDLHGAEKGSFDRSQVRLVAAPLAAETPPWPTPLYVLWHQSALSAPKSPDANLTPSGPVDHMGYQYGPQRPASQGKAQPVGLSYRLGWDGPMQQCAVVRMCKHATHDVAHSMQRSTSGT